jgi:uncharacterized protein YbaR (Trm112 family)
MAAGLAVANFAVFDAAGVAVDMILHRFIMPDLLSFLRCPEDHSELSFAGDDLISRVNAAIRAGRVTNRSGTSVTQTLDGALIRADGAVIYPILDGIPVLIAGDAISLDQIEGR